MSDGKFELAAEQAAVTYLEQHRVNELFSDLVATLAFKQPENPKEFLIEELKRRQAADGAKASLGLFSDAEIDARWSSSAGLLSSSTRT